MKHNSKRVEVALLWALLPFFPTQSFQPTTFFSLRSKSPSSIHPSRPRPTHHIASSAETTPETPLHENDDPTSTSTSSSTSPSTMISITFHQITSNPVLLTEFLMELGASSTTITDHHRNDSNNEQPIYDEQPPIIEINDFAVGKNVWRNCDVSALFPSSSSLDVPNLVQTVETTLELKQSSLNNYTLEEISNDIDWVKSVQENWKPIRCEGFVLRFPWHTDDDVREQLRNNEYEGDDDDDNEEEVIELELEGGIAFGTGEHATTQLCLGWIRHIISQNEKDNTIRIVLDYGTGSGVLGMGACALDKRIRAVGVDIDADAVRIANANAEANHLNMKSYLSTVLGDDAESDSLVMKSRQKLDVELLPNELSGSMYDACVANILAGPLIALKKTIAKMVKPKGYLGLSGVLLDQADKVVEAYQDYFDDVKVTKEKNGWVLITGTRKLE